MKRVQLLSLVTGTIMPLSEVQDPVFSQGMMGEGLGVAPTNGQIVAPAAGKVTMMAATLHAIGFTTAAGLEILVHLGIDTVELKDKPPFKLTIKVGDEVNAGDEIGQMDLAVIVAAGKRTTVIMAVTNSGETVASLTAKVGPIKAGDVEVKDTVTEPTTVAAKPASTGDGKYDQLATQIIENVGGAGNVKSVIHCITRVRFYLKDDGKANDDTIRNLKGVIDIAKAGGQYQVVIGPAVTDVYDAVVKQLGPGFGDDDASAIALEKEANKAAWKKMTPWQKVKHSFSALIGVITGSMIPVIGLLAASGILKGILSLLTYYKVVSTAAPTYVIINAMGDSVFYFLPIFVGFTAAKKLGSDPIIMGIVGGVLTYPTNC